MKALNTNLAGFFLKAAERIVPEIRSLTPAQQDDFLEIVDKMLCGRQPMLRRQFALFLSIVRWMPVLRYGKRWDSLDEKSRDDVLRRFQNAPIYLLRKGFWGLKTMVFVGYYGRPMVYEGLHYTPSMEGNDMLRANPVSPESEAR